MKLKKSQLKEAIKAIARDCLNERYGSDKLIREKKKKATPAATPAPAPAATPAPAPTPTPALPPVAPSVALPPAIPPAVPPVDDDQSDAKPTKKKGTSSDKSGATSGNSDVRSPTSTDVRSPTSTDVRSPTSTDVRSPTSTKTSTDAYTAGNVTVTGGAGSGDTEVHITQVPGNTSDAIKGRNITPDMKRAEMAIDDKGDPSSMKASLGKDSGGDSSMKANLGKESPSSMKAKLGKSDKPLNLKEIITGITRNCLTERHDSGQQKKIKQIVEFVIRKVPSIKRNPKKISEVAGQLFKKQFGVAAKSNLLMEAAYKIVAPRSATDAKEDKARRIQYEPKVNETQTLPPNKGQYKTVAPHAYTTADQNKALTFQSDPKVNEMGLTSGLKPDETECEPCGEEGQYNERDEIMLIKVMKLAADKLEAMHKGMSGDEEPSPFGSDSDLPLEPEEPSGKPSFGEPEEPSSDEPEEPFPSDTEEPSEEEPSDEPKVKEPPFKKKKEKKEEDPTEFTKKLAKENHKVQKRSYVTSNDNPVNPKNLRDPNVPGT